MRFTDALFFIRKKLQMELELLDEDIQLWSAGKETNIRLLLSTLHHVISPIFSCVCWDLSVWGCSWNCMWKIILLALNSDSLAQQRVACNPSNQPYWKLTCKEGLSESKVVSPPRQIATKRGYTTTKVRCRKGLLHPPGIQKNLFQ